MSTPFRFLLFAFVMALAPPALAFDLTDGLIAHYPFIGDAQDASGENNHGVPNINTVLTTDRFGTPASAYYFNGINSEIVVPGSPSLDSALSASTQFAWVRLDGFSQVGSNFGPILMKSTAATNAFMYRLDVAPFGIGIALGNWTNYAVADHEVPFDTWFNVAATWDGAMARFYFNGSLVDSTALTAALVPDGRPLVIGGDYPGSYESFWGEIDDIRVYNRALSDEEIAVLGEANLSPVAFGLATGIDLSDNYPNPFGSSTSVAFRRPGNSPLTIEVFDLAGYRVRQIAAGQMYGPEGSFSWDGRNDSGRPAPSGIYHFRVRTGDGKAATGRMVLQR